MDGKQLPLLKRVESHDFLILATSYRHLTKPGEDSDPQRYTLSTIVSLGRRHPNSWISSWLQLSCQSFRLIQPQTKHWSQEKHTAAPGIARILRPSMFNMISNCDRSRWSFGISRFVWPFCDPRFNCQLTRWQFFDFIFFYQNWLTYCVGEIPFSFVKSEAICVFDFENELHFFVNPSTDKSIFRSKKVFFHRRSIAPN